jgi:putative membrane protein
MLTVIGLVVAALAALLHVFIWVMESITWRAPATWRRFGVRDQDAADTVQPMAFNQGFYNLFLAIEVAVGVVLMAANGSGSAPNAAGWALTLFGLGSMLAASLVLSTRGTEYRRASMTQGALPLIALVLLLLRM